MQSDAAYKYYLFGGLGVLLLLGVVTELVKSSSAPHAQSADTAQLYADSAAGVIEYVHDYPYAADNEGYADADGASADTYYPYVDLSSPWRVEHFHNDWDEDTDPYLSVILDGTGWDLRVDFIPFVPDIPNGLFRFSIANSEGYMQDMYGPVEIKVRASDGITYDVDVTGVKGSMAFVEEQYTVIGLCDMLNNGKLDIKMTFGKYNERHQTIAHYDAAAGALARSVATLER